LLFLLFLLFFRVDIGICRRCFLADTQCVDATSIAYRYVLSFVVPFFDQMCVSCRVLLFFCECFETVKSTLLRTRASTHVHVSYHCLRYYRLTLAMPTIVPRRHFHIHTRTQTHEHFAYNKCSFISLHAHTIG
jgi:hypothetical protein